MKFRAHFDYDVEEASNEAVIPADQQGESLTVQSMAEDADINVLVARFGITGKMPENPRLPSYGDFTGISDYQSALEAVLSVNDGFMAMPADVRAKFDNDPQRMLEFISDEANSAECVKLGLFKEVSGGSAKGTARGEAGVGAGSGQSGQASGDTKPAG